MNRFERVVQILDNAVGGPTAPVGFPHVDFWRGITRDVFVAKKIGAPVESLDAAVFEGRNGEIAPSAQEPIVPFALQVQINGATIVGRDPIDLTAPAEIARRQPISFASNSTEVAAVTGISDRVAYRQTRKALLETDHASERES